MSDEAEAPQGSSARDGKRVVYLAISVTTTLLVLWPTLQHEPQDSFPFSSYPMFARPRGTPVIERLVGVAHDGERIAVTPDLLGTGEVLQAKTLIRDAVRRGRRARRKLCRQVAQRVAEEPGLRHIEALELVSSRYDSIEYLLSSPELRRPLSTRVRARCEVVRE